MLTTGFKIYISFALVGLVAMSLYGVASGDLNGDNYLGILDPAAIIGVLSLGWKGGVGDHVGYAVLLFFTIAAGFLGLTLVGYRDADAEAVARLTDTGDIPPAAGPTANNIWPFVGALSVGVTMFGLVVGSAIFVVGLILLAVVGLEWMMSAWADRATADPAVNAELRTRIMAPFEIPLLAGGVIAVVVLSASRIMLTVSAANAVWLAMVMTLIIMAAAIAIAMAPEIKKSTIVSIIAVGVIAIVTLGIVSAAVGPREFHEPEGETHEAVVLNS